MPPACPFAARVSAALADPAGRLPRDAAAHLPTCPVCRAAAAAAIRAWPTGRSPAGALPEWLSAPGENPTLSSFQAEAVAGGRCSDLELGPYLLLDKLGSGGMGEVFKARHRFLGRIDAVKTVRPDIAAHPSAVRRFLREAEAAAKLRHPNVVQVYTADRAGDGYYLAMEYVPGTDLGKLVLERGPLPVAEACEYAAQAADGLHHAFAHGLVHRDVKPANLLLVEDRGQRTEDRKTPVASRSGLSSDLCPLSPLCVKVADFGLARAFQDDSAGGEVTATGVILGTTDYMAPEQAEDSRSADTRADVYSLGCTLFHLLAGRPPFPGGSLRDKLNRHAAAGVPPLSALRPDVPPTVEQVVRKCMAKRPGDRFQTPGELAAALRTAVASATDPEPLPPPDGDETHSYAPSRARRLPSPRRPKPWVWAVAGVLAVAAAGVAIVQLSRGPKPDDAAKTDPPKPEPKPPPKIPPRAGVPLPKAGASAAAGPWAFAGACSSDRTDKIRVVGFLADGTIVAGRAGHLEDGTDSVWWEGWPKDGGGKTLWGGRPAGTVPHESPICVHPAAGLVTDRFRRFAPITLTALPPLSADLDSYGGGTSPNVECLSVTGDGRGFAGAATPEDWDRAKVRYAVLWEAETGKVKSAWQVKSDKGIAAAAGNHTGGTVAAGTVEGRVVVGTTRGDRERAWTAPAEPGKKPDPVSAIAVSPDGSVVYSAHGDEGAIHVWDVAGDRRVTELHRGWHVYRLAVSPDGRWLVAAGNAVTVWNLSENPPKPHELAEHWTGDLKSAAFSPDGARLVVGGWARRGESGDGESVVWVWDLKP